MNDNEIRLHGPFLMEMKVYIINTETEQAGTLSVGLPPMKYATPDQVKDRIEKFVNGELEKHAPGFRVMTKEEAWRHHCLDNYSQVFAMPGGFSWDEFDPEIDNKPIEIGG